MLSFYPVLPGLLLLALLSLLVRRPWRGRLSALACASLFLWSWGPAALFFSTTLEAWYPARPLPPGDAEVIVVLSASALPVNPGRQEMAPGLGTYQRCAHAAWLHRAWKPLPVVVTGGTVRNGKGWVQLASVMRRQLEQQGVPSDMIWKEDRSLSTAENAAYCAAMLRPKGIHRVALVTEAYHMLRSERSFRKAGFEVTPAPCCFRTPDYDWGALVPQARFMEWNDTALYEWAGLAWYRLRGRI